MYTYGMDTCGMYTYGMDAYGMYTYRMYTYGMYAYGMYTYGNGMYTSVISKSVFRYRKVPFYPTNIDNVSFYGKFIDIDIDAQY